MKFKEMSWEELEKDFSNILNNKTNEEIVNSLDKYVRRYSKVENKKVICPNCKSEHLTYFREFYITRYYQLDNNNEPTNKCIRRTGEDSSIMPENWECLDCGCIFGGTANISCEYKEV